MMTSDHVLIHSDKALPSRSSTYRVAALSSLKNVATISAPIEAHASQIGPKRLLVTWYSYSPYIYIISMILFTPFYATVAACSAAAGANDAGIISSNFMGPAGQGLPIASWTLMIWFLGPGTQPAHCKQQTNSGECFCTHLTQPRYHWLRPLAAPSSS